MKNNPFYDATFYVSNQRLSDKLMDASIMWGMLTDDGKHADDQDLYTVLSAFDLDDIQCKYEFYRKNEKEFDFEALKKAVEEWTFEV